MTVRKSRLFALVIIMVMPCLRISGGEDPEVKPAHARQGAFIVTGESWKAQAWEEAGWKLPGFDDSGWLSSAVGYQLSPDSYYPQLDPANVFGFETSARWIWHPRGGSSAFFRRTFEIGEIPEDVELVTVADDLAKVYANGVLVCETGTDVDRWGGRAVGKATDLRPFLVKGRNVIAAQVEDRGVTRGFCAEIQVGGVPLRDRLDSIVKGVAPESIIPRWRPAYDLRGYEPEELFGLYRRKGARRNTVSQLKALMQIWKKGPDAAAAALGEILLSGEPVLARDAAEAAALLRLKDLAPLIEDALCSIREPAARISAAAALGAVGGKSAVPLLAQIVLETGPPPGSDPESMVRQLTSPNPEDRRAVIEALKKMGLQALPALEKAAASEDPALRIRAVAVKSCIEKDEAAGLNCILRRTAADAIRAIEKRG